jgi:hypothetical protein
MWLMCSLSLIVLSRILLAGFRLGRIEILWLSTRTVLSQGWINIFMVDDKDAKFTDLNSKNLI